MQEIAALAGTRTLIPDHFVCPGMLTVVKDWDVIPDLQAQETGSYPARSE